jgi:hypothetical protein
MLVIARRLIALWESVQLVGSYECFNVHVCISLCFMRACILLIACGCSCRIYHPLRSPAGYSAACGWHRCTRECEDPVAAVCND